jgi:hypothetical protein
MNWISEASRLLKIARAAAPQKPAMPHGNLLLLDAKFVADVNKLMTPSMPATGA